MCFSIDNFVDSGKLWYIMDTIMSNRFLNNLVFKATKNYAPILHKQKTVPFIAAQKKYKLLVFLLIHTEN